MTSAKVQRGKLIVYLKYSEKQKLNQGSNKLKTTDSIECMLNEVDGLLISIVSINNAEKYVKATFNGRILFSKN